MFHKAVYVFNKLMKLCSYSSYHFSCCWMSCVCIFHLPSILMYQISGSGLLLLPGSFPELGTTLVPLAVLCTKSSDHILLSIPPEWSVTGSVTGVPDFSLLFPGFLDPCPGPNAFRGSVCPLVHDCKIPAFLSTWSLCPLLNLLMWEGHVINLSTQL